MSAPAATIERLAERLGAGLRAQHLTLATAESCTAGGLGYAVTLVPGSSQWYDRGFVTYSNESKMQMLGVSTAYLRDFGAVSEPVARAMAIGALSHGAAQVAVAVTGIAEAAGRARLGRRQHQVLRAQAGAQPFGEALDGPGAIVHHAPLALRAGPPRGSERFGAAARAHANTRASTLATSKV